MPGLRHITWLRSRLAFTLSYFRRCATYERGGRVACLPVCSWGGRPRACAWRPSGLRVGLFLVRAAPVVCLALATIRLYAVPLHLVGPWPTVCMWFGSE